MSLLIAAVLAVPAYVLWESNRLASWLCIGVIVLVLFVGAVFRADARAYVNCRNYWARGGPER